MSQKYQLITDGVRLDVMDVIAGLYEVDQETYLYCRRLLEDWMYQIANMMEYQEPEESKYRPMGYRGSWMDNPPEDD